MSQKNSNPFNIFYFALRGIYLALKFDRNSRIQIACAVLVLIVALFLKVTITEFLIICVAAFLVIAFELVNTAFEKLLDFIHPGFNERVGQLKDMMAGAVFTSAILAFVVGIVILAPKILNLIF